MTIDDAIKQLKAAKKEGVKNIVLAWWKADEFDEKDNDAWHSAAIDIEDTMDWSRTHEELYGELDFHKANIAADARWYEERAEMARDAAEDAAGSA